MTRIANLFLRVAVVLVGIGALAFLLREPWLEGRNAHATAFQVYFRDPFLAFAYLASVPFFVTLVQALRLLARIGRGEAFSQGSVKALRTIRLCALSTIGFVVAGEFLFILFNDSDDRAGGVFMGNLIIFLALVAAAAATVQEGILRAGMRENSAPPAR
jgi:hypothetical protein